MIWSGVGQIVRCAPIDFVVIAVYFVAILGFGLSFSRFSKTTKDFFLGGQRFSGWLLAFSLVASVIGTYSFIKYSDAGFRFGLSSSMTYLNDWFYVPLLMFVWLPVIYFSRVRSVPEYFHRRFDSRARLMCAALLSLYMLGYVGYTIYTLGTVTKLLLDVPLMPACVVIAAVTGIYVTIGGQTAIIFTDLAQAFLLIGAGVTLVILGVFYLGGGEGFLVGLDHFWENLPLSDRLPFANFNRPADFNFVGVFWQDMANSCVFFFVNQGLIMRFLAARSMVEGRRTILVNSLVLLPFAVLVVGGPGWIGNAISRMDPAVLDPDTNGSHAFVVIAYLLCKPGVFGLMMAALVAALMSTVDTMLNALAAICVIDVYQPYIAPGREDRHYLRVARIVSIAATVIGLFLVTLFARFDSIYEAHAAFTAAVTPPLAVSVLLGVMWKRYTPAAAFGTLVIGAVAAIVSFYYPQVVRPFMDLHGMAADARPSYMRALFLLVVSGVGGVVITTFTKPKPEAEIQGLYVGSIEAGRVRFKNGQPNDRPSKPIVTSLVVVDQPIRRAAKTLPDYPVVSLSRAQMLELAAEPGDLLYVCDRRRYLGGLRSIHAAAGAPCDGDDGVRMDRDTLDRAHLFPDRPVRVEKIL